MDCDVEMIESKPGSSEQNPNDDGVSPQNMFITIANTKVNLSYLLNEEVWHRSAGLEAQIRRINIVTNMDLDYSMEDMNDETAFETLWKAVDEDPIKNFNYFRDECTKDEFAFVSVAVKISVQSIIKLCRHIYETKDLGKEFLSGFHTHFLIALLKRKYDWLTMDLLIRSSVTYRNEFDVFLKWLVNDLDVTNRFLADYAKIINKERKTKILEMFCDVHFTKEEFAHFLLGIYHLYDGCVRTDDIFQFILHNMILTSEHCARNKNYGKLLHSIVKEPSSYAMNRFTVRKLVDDHGTVYKAPCYSILDGNALERLHLHVNLINRPRIMIPTETNTLSLSV